MQCPSAAAAGPATLMQEPSSSETFASAKVDWTERDRHREALALHRDLIALRKSDPVISAQPGVAKHGIDGAVIDTHAFVLRYFGNDGDDRLLVVNLQARLHADPVAEPLLAPPAGKRWRTIWSSEDLSYGGSGTSEMDGHKQGWWLTAQSAVLLGPAEINATTAAR
jgi:maltooligosyltrehalose trehalohydrolase